jgi:tetratricopeptide (TPR) repeat protein
VIGVFFLFAQGRISLVRGQPAKAIECYKKAAEAQEDYQNLHLISYWEIAIANLALWNIEESLKYWEILREKGTVSPSQSHT